jgi:SWI/SNF-related matrix-associated actin-dependent regulator 1 of chromatin subfamily A
MGLGKTIQGIASMSIYHEEWPVLVLTPSSARYHWESEFQQWLGVDSPVNSSKQQRDIPLSKESQSNSDTMDGEKDCPEEYIPLEDYKPQMQLLDDTEIHVLTSGKEDILSGKYTRVVVCSYGLAPSLVESGKIKPGQFKCAIVDER